MSKHIKVHDILGRELGGKWRKADVMERWYSDDHDYSVYRSCETLDSGTTKLVYRRSDNQEIIYRPYLARMEGCR